MTPLRVSTAVLVLVAAACVEESGSSSTTSGPAPTTTSTTIVAADEGTQYGFFPFPNGTTFEAVVAHFEDLSDHADVVLVQPEVPWEDFVDGVDGDSESRENIRNLTILAGQKDLGTIFVIDPLNGLDRREFFGLPADWDPSFANPDVRAAIANFTLWIVAEFEPRYLGLSSEINTYMQAHPDEADAYLSLYREIHAMVKAAAPETQVFVTFQWEQVNGMSLAGFDAGIAPDPDWEQIEVFEPDLDLWVISSYPFVAFPTGADIPDDYYRPLLDRTDKPLAVAEGGYLSRPTGPFPGNPQDQVDHLTAVHAQIGGRLAFWIQLVLDDFDPSAIGGPMREQGHSDRDVETLGIFSSIGLREFDTTAKPALAVWDGYRAGR